MHKRKTANEPKIEKSFSDVNKIFKSESPEQRRQREAPEVGPGLTLIQSLTNAGKIKPGS